MQSMPKSGEAMAATAFEKEGPAVRGEALDAVSHPPCKGALRQARIIARKCNTGPNIICIYRQRPHRLIVAAIRRRDRCRRGHARAA